MSEGQVGSGPGSEEPGGESAGTEPAVVDPATVLLAVERVQGEVAALGRAVAATPEEVAARLDVDAAAAAINVRVSALGSALDQLRLSLLAALDRTADRLESPPWLAELHSVLVGLGRRFDAPVWMPELQGALAELGSPGTGEAKGRETAAEISLALERSPRLEALSATVASLGNDRRLDEVVRAVTQLAEGIRAGHAVAEALDHLGGRLEAIENAAAGAAREASALSTRVGSVPERLSAIASQVDRITPLARVGDQAGTLFDRLDRVTAGVEELVALIRGGGAGGRDEEAGDDARFEAVVDVLSGVTRRQDEVTAAVGSMLDQIRSPKGLESVLERGEQRERSLAARLDRIDDELRRLIERGSLDIASPAAAIERLEQELAPRLDRIGNELRRVIEGGSLDVAPQAAAVEAVRSTVERQEKELAARLDRIDLELRRVGEAAGESNGARLEELRRAVSEIGVAVERSPRLEELTTAVASLGNDSRIDDVAAAVAQLADGVRAGAAVADALDGLGDRLAAIEAAGNRAADETRALSERLAPLPDDLGAIASKVNGITQPSHGDEEPPLRVQLERLASGIDHAVRLLSARDALAIDDRLDQLSVTVTRLANTSGGAEEEDERVEALVDVLSGVTRRQDEVTAAVASIVDRVQQQEHTIAEHLDWVGDRLAAFAAQLAPGHAAPGADGWPEDERFEVAAVLDRMSRRQDELAAAISELVDQGRGPTATNAVFDRMEQRERSLAARLDRIDLELRRRATAGGGDGAETADESVVADLAASVDEVATVTSSLAGAVEDLAERLDHRLSNVEASLGGRRRSPSAPARPSASSEVAALRLAELRAERAQVQARLQEERLLAAEARDES